MNMQRKRMVVRYSDWVMKLDPNVIGLPQVTTHVKKVEFCCDKMKEKWTKEIGFCANSKSDFAGAHDPYLFWTLDVADKTIGPLGLLIGSHYGYAKDKIGECPFCHSRIKFVKEKEVIF